MANSAPLTPWAAEHTTDSEIAVGTLKRIASSVAITDNLTHKAKRTSGFNVDPVSDSFDCSGIAAGT